MADTSDSVGVDAAVESQTKEPELEQAPPAEETKVDEGCSEEAEELKQEDSKSDDATTEDINPVDANAEDAKAEIVEETETPPEKPEEATSEEAKSEEKVAGSETVENGTAHGDTVAKHYNENPQVSKEGRKDSRIFHLRNFNNWVKSVMINEFLEKVKRNKKHREELNVLDLGCGKGGDYLKWHKGAVSHVICADIAETSLEQCKERFQSLRRGDDSRRHRENVITTEFIHADCTKKRLKDSYLDANIHVDLTSCQFAYHYSFESMEQADMMLKNACESLRDGGYFIGTTPDAFRLVQRAAAAEGNSFGNDIFDIAFEDKDNLPLFGAKYNFKLHEVVDCPEFLVYFPAFERMAEKYNMKLVYKKNFHELFQEKNEDYTGLLYRMQALEGLPARDGKALSNDKEDAYEEAKKLLENPPTTTDAKYKSVGTLSKDEWEAAGIYLAFAFQKCNPKPEEEEKPAETPSEPAEASADSKEEVAVVDAKMTDVADPAEDAAEKPDTVEQQDSPAADESAVAKDSEPTEDAAPDGEEDQAESAEADDEPASKRSRPSEDE